MAYQPLAVTRALGLKKKLESRQGRQARPPLSQTARYGRAGSGLPATAIEASLPSFQQGERSFSLSSLLFNNIFLTPANKTAHTSRAGPAITLSEGSTPMLVSSGHGPSVSLTPLVRVSSTCPPHVFVSSNNLCLSRLCAVIHIV